MGWRVLVGLAALLSIAGCASNSEKALARKVGVRVQIGMPIAKAAASLRAAGFSCDGKHASRSMPASIECDRHASHYVLATCLQRVFLETDRAVIAVSRIEVRKPACAGF